MKDADMRECRQGNIELKIPLHNIHFVIIIFWLLYIGESTGHKPALLLYIL